MVKPVLAKPPVLSPGWINFWKFIRVIKFLSWFRSAVLASHSLSFLINSKLFRFYTIHFDPWRSYTQNGRFILAFNFQRRRFFKANQPPQFLSIETAQYCMEKAISPFLEQGFFQSLVLSRNRIYGQILDNLNKSAIIRFPINEISQLVSNPLAILMRAFNSL